MCEDLDWAHPYGDTGHSHRIPKRAKVKALLMSMVRQVGAVIAENTLPPHNQRRDGVHDLGPG